MKKILTTALTAALCISAVGTTAFAAEINQDTDPKTANTTVNYTVESSGYVIVIPESVNLGENLTITCEKANTEPNKYVRVSVSGLTDDGKISLSRKLDNSYKITADISQNNTSLSNDSTVAAFQNITTLTNADPIVVENPQSPDSFPIKAGEYSGTITFTVSYTNICI